MTNIAKNLDKIRNKIENAAKKSGRSFDSVTLVAVSKIHSADSIRQAYNSGQRHFGENYANELLDKSKKLSSLDEIKWHFIGHLQRNKAKYVVQNGAMIETIDSIKLIDEISKQATKSELTIDCLVQVNVGKEEQKSGCREQELDELLVEIENKKNLNLKGLMTIPPWELEPDETRKYFIDLRELRDNHGGPKRLPHLSMGMSHDFEVAVEEGSTIVRVGTAIFGQRQYNK